MSNNPTIKWLERKFVKRPFVGIAVALLAPIVAQAATDSPIVTNTILIVAWAILTVEIYRSTRQKFLSATSHVPITVTLSCIVAAGLYSGLWKNESLFEIDYMGQKLNGREITLVRNPNATLVPTEMYVWECPACTPSVNAFVTAGLYATNEGQKPLEPDAAYLSFDGKVDIPQQNASSWRRSSVTTKPGWSTFEAAFGRMTISPKHRVSIDQIIAEPVPNKPMKTRLTIIYGDREETAEFTIRR